MAMELMLFPILLATAYYGEGQQLTIHYPQNPLVSTAGADTSAFPIGGAPRVNGRGLLDGALREVIKHSPPLVCRTLGTLLYRYAA